MTPGDVGDLRYAGEKFATAVHAMAVSEAPLRRRIAEAWESFSAVGEEDFPEGSTVRKDFVSLVARTTWCDANADEGTLAATLGVVSEAECRRLAQLICDVQAGIEFELYMQVSEKHRIAHFALGALLDRPGGVEAIGVDGDEVDFERSG